MSIETEGVDSIQALLDSGKLSDSSSIADIEAALNGAEPAAAATTDDGKAAADTGTTGETADKSTTEPGKTDAPGETQAADKAAATEGKQTGEQTASAPDTQTGQAAGSDAEESARFSSHPLFGVLKGTRTSLQDAKEKLQEVAQERDQERQAREKAERELAELKTAQTAQTRDVQAAATAAGVKGDVRTIDVSKLRDNFPGEIVDAIEALQTQNTALTTELKDLRSQGARVAKSEEERALEAQQADIDAVPSLAEWQAEGKLKWTAAKALDDALLEDPEWSGKPRVERYREIAKQLGGSNLGGGTQQQTATSTVTTTTAGTKAKADEALARAEQTAVPLSHSGLPAGSPPAQSETESLDRLDPTQIADKMSRMSDDQIEAMLAKASAAG